LVEGWQALQTRKYGTNKEKDTDDIPDLTDEELDILNERLGGAHGGSIGEIRT